MSKSNVVQFVHHYGPIQAWRDYEVLNEGYDWVAVKHGGGSIHVPSNLIRTNEQPPRYTPYPVEEEEEGLV